LHRRFLAEGAIVLAALFFGSTFILVKDAVEDISPLGYLLVRFSVGTLALAPFAWVIARRDRAATPPALLVRGGLLAGALLFGGYVFQTVGLQYTSASTSAFVTGLYAVFTPVFESIFRRRPPAPSVCAGIAVAIVGLYLLTGARVSLGAGEFLTLGCAATFGLQIFVIGAFADRLHPIPFTAVQLGVVAALALPSTATTGLGHLTGLAIFAAVFTGIACSSVALSLQVYGQRRIGASRAALILLSEPVFAGIFGYLAGERLGLLRLTGAAIILGGIALAELAPGREAEVDVIATLDQSVKSTGE
jgi:drug/metabolite transporter (DMT)-like permease